MKNRLKINREALRQEVDAAGLKKGDLAAMLSVTRETFSRWLSGKIPYIDEDKLLLLARVLQCQPSQLSDELKQTVPAPLRPKHEEISGDKVIEMALVAGYYNELSSLIAHSQSSVIENLRINSLLVDSVSRILNLELSQFLAIVQKSTNLELNYERFDTAARKNLLEALASLIDDDLTLAVKRFRIVIIRAQSFWLIGLAYLGLALSQIFQGKRSEARESLRQGLDLYVSSEIILDQWVGGNLHLVSIWLSLDEPQQAMHHLNMAKEIFDEIPAAHSLVRCLSYEAIIASYQGNSDRSLYLTRKVLSKKSDLPHIFQLEVLLNCSSSLNGLDHGIKLDQIFDDFRNLNKRMIKLAKSLKVPTSNNHLESQ
ncbi:helix-turn-helix domain-containing protein [Pseudobacteriovorax antillogorgiicola]|uniref:Cro/C1-type HTH DNA-binding domain-containing protein n=1 Tax=Pseudobacteriovorax antillogorgiicola TaxID=1513793 RepID=A0A1Y6CMR9_9BACT|nr:helix-turn-helix transcriptional regulator [Pseudobacteriovorax antillogorgiicola]TCS44969.1 Cro/C1-type helix-turn-helix DNA-binding protein [Pseudobacteriovorax antillogorgiicola]SMF76813.1 Cro/C1-type HTH DNA-binding domain-containing protein [Pseudobacteriovorax antillogorgiicola]